MCLKSLSRSLESRKKYQNKFTKSPNNLFYKNIPSVQNKVETKLVKRLTYISILKNTFPLKQSSKFMFMKST